MTPSATEGAAFLDTSAFVKWFAEEHETAAFRSEIDGWPRLVASRLLEVEALRVGARLDAFEAAAKQLEPVELVAIDDHIVSSAARVGPPQLRSLDAIHLATALRLQEDVGAFFTYDHGLADAAREHGFDVRSPGA